MEKAFDVNSKLGDIVAEFPLAKDIFVEYKLDFCCGGNRTLSAASKEANIDENTIINRINALFEEKSSLLEKKDWNHTAYSQLIDYIIPTHHVYMQRELPEVSELVNKILRVHGPSHEYINDIHKLFHTLKMDIDQHLIKEEEILFPLIKHYEATKSKELLSKILMIEQQMEKEHLDAGDLLKKLRDVTNDYTLPEDACKTFAKTYQKLEEIEKDLFEHIHLENNILFKRLKDEYEG